MLNAHRLEHCEEKSICNSTQKIYYTDLCLYNTIFGSFGSYFRLYTFNFRVKNLIRLPVIYCYEDFKSILIIISNDSKMMSFEFKQQTSFFLDIFSDSDYPSTLLMHYKLADEYFLCEGLLFALFHPFDAIHETLRI